MSVLTKALANRALHKDYRFKENKNTPYFRTDKDVGSTPVCGIDENTTRFEVTEACNNSENSKLYLLMKL